MASNNIESIPAYAFNKYTFVHEFLNRIVFMM